MKKLLALLILGGMPFAAIPGSDKPRETPEDVYFSKKNPKLTPQERVGVGI